MRGSGKSKRMLRKYIIVKGSEVIVRDSKGGVPSLRDVIVEDENDLENIDAAGHLVVGAYFGLTITPIKVTSPLSSEIG